MGCRPTNREWLPRPWGLVEAAGWKCLPNNGVKHGGVKPGFGGFGVRCWVCAARSMAGGGGLVCAATWWSQRLGRGSAETTPFTFESRPEELQNSLQSPATCRLSMEMKPESGLFLSTRDKDATTRTFHVWEFRSVSVRHGRGSGRWMAMFRAEAEPIQTDNRLLAGWRRRDLRSSTNRVRPYLPTCTQTNNQSWFPRLG